MRQRQRQVADLVAIVKQIISESEGHLRSAQLHIRRVDELNARIIRVLTLTTGRNLGGDREAWRKWWKEEKGYAYETPKARPRQDLTRTDSKPTYENNVHLESHSCFAAGTLVQTLAGLRSIESMEVGDQVLTQDPQSGALGYEPVVAAVHNKPAMVLQIELGDETIQATEIHRFWQVGHGWIMARDLKPGDRLRSLGGVTRVTGVTRGPIEAVFNLKVMHAQSFFVGERGMLVHDNSAVEPVRQPFDRVQGFAGDH
jgi:Pretoxin HINT domain